MNGSRAQLFRSLAVMVRAGVPILRAVQTLKVQWREYPAGPSLDRFHLQLCQGKSLSQAGRGIGEPFQELHLAVFALGEQSGSLDEALEVLAGYEEDRSRLGQQIRSQLAYPLLVLATMLVLLGVGLPWLARALPGTVSWPTSLLVLTGVGAVSLGHRRVVQWLGTCHPFSDLRKAWASSQFLGLWSGLLERGVPIAQSLVLAGRASPCPECRQACQQLISDIVEGGDLGQVFQASAYFAPAVKGCVVAGVESGRLPAMLGALKRLEDQRIGCALDSSVALITPFVMVLLGLLLLLFLHQTLTPIMGMMGNL
ncbi:type II secretion system F family protein [bacterium]|nr:type II secretion system F family protein [bacterium]